MRPKEAFASGHISGSWWLQEPSEKALKELCDLRRVVLIGEDLEVAKMLQRLQVARPQRLFLADFKAFERQFGFCFKKELPLLPALLLEKGPSWPAVYLGPKECLETPEVHRKQLRKGLESRETGHFWTISH